ncbi:MAG TPA: Omp28-related outer membrane protein, partial [Candidatus Syntrophosphaera sp.]|nr:Omp28-related outer membrane protein [Candidatus Syntrophosphaera sp.]
GAAMACHDLLQNGDPVAVVKNHNSDAYANTYSNARNSLYGIGSYPTAKFDGVLTFSGGSGTSSVYTSYLPLVNQRMEAESHYTLNASGSSNGNQYNLQVMVAKPEPDNNTNVVLHAVITESAIPQVWFNQTTVENVNRMMVPSQNGTPVSLATGGQTTVSLDFTLNSSWVADNCELVLFLQNMTSKEILQAQKYSLNNVTGGYPVSLYSHDFSIVPVGEEASIPVFLTNYAAYPVSGTITTDNPAFSPSVSSFNLPPYQILSFSLSFAPTGAEDYLANLFINGNIWNYPELSISMTGTGYLLAQDYVFQASGGAYAPILGGILLGNTGTRNIAFVDPASPAGSSTVMTGPGFPIGFDFNFLGMDFDRLAIHSNGWISLGQSALQPSVNLSSSNTGTPVSSTAEIDPFRLVSRIAGLARFLQAQTGAELRLETVGSAPERECVIQWTNYRRVNINGDSFNFQIRLLENGNRIRVVYGDFSFGNANAMTAEVGLRGLPDDPADNFMVLSSDTSWTNPEEGSTNISRMTLSSALYPPNGTTYTWLPQGLLPEAPALSYPADGATGLPLTGFDLAWTPPASGGTPDYYAIYMANSLESLFDQEYFETTGTSFDPVADGGLTFNYGEMWFWTVQSNNDFGAAVAEPAFRFDIEDPTGLDAPILSIGTDGTLGWQEVTGAQSYNIFRADAPNGNFLPVGTSAGLSWQDPAYSQDRAFYRITAAVD